MNSRPSREVSTSGMIFIEHAEGAPGTGDPVLTAYRDSKGILTIGWGHTGADVVEALTITRQQAEMLLEEDLDDAERAVSDLITVPLGQNQFDALVSFVFNVGVGAFTNSRLRTRLNAGDYAAVPGELSRWNKITINPKTGEQKTLDGLTNRRTLEAALWNTPDSTEDANRPPASPQHVNDAAQITPMQREEPTPPPTKVSQVTGGKGWLTALGTGGAGVIANGYTQVKPTIDAVQRIATDTASMGQWMRVFAVVLALASIGAMGWALWQKHREVAGK